jgi:geranylgeranyl reductase family protein
VIDAAVVGGGPVGSRTAAILAKEGFSVEILEENREIGRPVQCAGLVSPRTHAILGKPTILNELRAARIRAPLGTVLDVRAPDVRAVAIDRAEADKLVAREAAQAGASIKLGWQLASMKTGPDCVKLVPSKGEPVEARLVVGADGAYSAVRRLSGIEPPAEMLPAFECEIACAGPEASDDTVDIWLGREIAPEFFAWSIPTGSSLRVGLAASPGVKNARELLDSLLARSGLDSSRLLGTYAGVIPIGMVEKPFGDRTMLVGDAAGHVKPLSGGGLFPGLQAAEVCAKAAAKSLEEDELDSRALSHYTAELREALGREVVRATTLRSIFKGLDDAKLDSTLKTLSKRSAVALVAAEGDIDYPSRLSKGLLAKCPGLLGLAPGALKSLL